MTQQGLPLVDYVVIALYLGLTVGIGLYFSRFMKGGKDFFLGGNLIPWWAAGISLYMTTFSAWMFTGAASFAYQTGWFGILFFAVKPIGFFIGFQLSAWRWRRTRVTSPVEYVRTRFNKPTHLFLSIVFILSMMYWPGHHLASLSKIVAPALFPNSMVAVDVMVIVSGILILIYTFSGGLWAVCITDVVQFLILFCICIVLIPVCFLSGEIGSPGTFLGKIPPLEFRHVIDSTTVYDHWYLIGFLVAGIFGNAVGDKAQRYYSVRDENAARRVGWLAFGLFLTGPILFGIPPLVGKVLWPDISQLTYFSSIIRPEENIFIAVVMRYLPAGLVGIFLSAMMAASMSALDSVWNTVSSIVSIDIYKGLLRPKAGEKEILLVGRVTVVVLCGIGIIMALTILHSSLGIFTFSNIVLGLIGIPVTIPLLIGIISRNISRWSAMASILAGILMASVTRFGLDFSLGQQYIATITVSLLFIYLSVSLGRLFLYGRKYAMMVSLGVVLIFWTFFFSSGSNPELSFRQISDVSQGGVTGVFLLPGFWVSIAALAFGGLVYGFSLLFARDLLGSHPEVEEIFRLIDTPIDVEKEVQEDTMRVRRVYSLVGWIAMGLAALTLLILVFPTGRVMPGANIALSFLLLMCGGLVFFAASRGKGIQS